ncbi:MAG: hypothetical protein LBU65_16580 [Planctomycetaceae bacterium]|jgi:Leucine-rich repeat (LRR) protein|nr:hypothetical protein [Planctomycetaceae bacterium]
MKDTCLHSIVLSLALCLCVIGCDFTTKTSVSEKTIVTESATSADPPAAKTSAEFKADGVISDETFNSIIANTGLTSLQLTNCREFDDAKVEALKPLVKLKKLALTNTGISDASVVTIKESFPELVELNLSYNPKLTNAAMKTIAAIENLERLEVIQCSFNDIGALQFANMSKLQVLDIRGNNIGNIGLRKAASMPSLRALKHRSTALSDDAIEILSECKTLEILDIEDAVITAASGKFFQNFPNLSQLDLFRCSNFSNDGVTEMDGLKLTRLLMRGMTVNDEVMPIIAKMTMLKTLVLHEMPSIGDEGIGQLSTLKDLRTLDIWAMEGVTDKSIEVISKLPNIDTLSIRDTGITDSSIDLILQMPKLQNLTLKGNTGTTSDGIKKLAAKKFKKLAAQP